MKSIITTTGLLLLLFTVTACGGSENSEPSASAGNGNDSELTQFELEHGFGPITERIDIDDEIDMDKVAKGQNIYEMKCEMCHNMGSRMVGPPLGAVTETRSPEFIMNFILNPSENVRKHPIGQALLREYLTEMPYQNVQEDEARAIVEYLRHYAETEL